MLTPERAAKELVRRGHAVPNSGMDDPEVTTYPVRWWWNGDGVLCLTAWRCPTLPYPWITLVEGSSY